MSDKIKGFTVTLEQDISIDDIGDIVSAINMIKYVASVEPSTSSIDDQMNRESVRFEYREKFRDFYIKEFK